jgi:hypothetical protein
LSFGAAKAVGIDDATFTFDDMYCVAACSWQGWPSRLVATAENLKAAHLTCIG